MKGAIKIIIILVISILLILSLYIVFFRESDNSVTPDNSDDEPDNPDDNNGDDNNDGNDGNETNGDNNETDNDKSQTRFVFIEEGTFTTCKFCVEVADILHDLYKSADYPIYYVSMIREIDNAKNRLENDYNIHAYPTVFIDGGYKVVYGLKDKSVFISRINEALERNRPILYVNLTAIWNQNNSEITMSGVVENMENTSYNGFLKVYLTEIVSTDLTDYDGIKYKFAFQEFLLENDVELGVNESYNFTKTFDDAGFDPENLKIFAVVFNSDSIEKVSNPPDDGGDGSNTFNAYYVDGVYTADVVEGGNTPPDVGITIPQPGKIHIFGNKIFDRQFSNTFIIGRITVEVHAEDDGGISKVEFYIDGALISIDNSAPFECEIRKIGTFRNLIRKHTITVKAFDDTGKTSDDSIEVFTFFL
jgi:hypothetical protein